MIANRPADLAAQTSGDEFNVGAVAGGEETSPLWTSEVSASAFRSALVASMTNYGLYDPSSDLRIDAVLEQMDQPLVGISMTVTSTVNYRVLGPGDDVLLERRIVAPYTAEFSDAFMGVERLRLANEGSIRENIRRFLEVLVETPFLGGESGPTGAGVS